MTKNNISKKGFETSRMVIRPVSLFRILAQDKVRKSNKCIKILNHEKVYIIMMDMCHGFHNETGNQRMVLVMKPFKWFHYQEAII